MRDIAKNIRLLRTAKKMTQDELAEKLFVTRQTVSNYETGKSRPDVDMLERIAEVLETDMNTVIYGPQTAIQNPDLKPLLIGTALAVAAWMAFLIFSPLALDYRGKTYHSGPVMLLVLWLCPLACLLTGWTLAQLVGMALKKKPFRGNITRWICAILVILVLLWLVLMLWYTGAVVINDILFSNHLRGEWVETDGINVASHAWSILLPPIPVWLEWIASRVFLPMVQYWPYLLFLSGCGLWLTGFPMKKE